KRLELEHAAAHDARGMHHQLFGVDAADDRVVPHLRTAGEDDAARALGGRERVLGVLELVDVAGNQLALARAAVAGLAGEGKREAGAQERREHRVARLHGDGLVVANEGDLHAAPGEPRMVPIVWTPNKLVLKPGVLSGLLGYRLRVAQQAVFRDFARAIPEASPGRVGILFLIEANPGVTQSRLAHAVGLDRSTMVGVLDALEARELVERRRGEDRRTNGLWLTRAGRDLVASLTQRI